MEETMNRFPNLFYFYGHDHAGDYLPAKRRTAEDMYTRSGYVYEQYNDNGRERLKSPDAFNRCRFNSDLVLAEGFHEAYAGRLGFYYTKFFKNNGVKAPSDLRELVTPFSQGCAVEVYDDRVVLTLQNFGTKQGTALLPSSTYRLDPLVCPLRRTAAPKPKSKK